VARARSSLTFTASNPEKIMAKFSYLLGTVTSIRPLYPPAKFLDHAKVKLKNDCAVIAHYTTSSMQLDGFANPACHVTITKDAFKVEIQANAPAARLKAFAQRHQAMMSAKVGGKAVAGMKLMQQLGVWNPMSGYPVNNNPDDGDCKWNLFLPLGMGILNHRAVMLLHYPPWQALREASYLNNMTLQRWVRLLGCIGIPEAEADFYKTIVDVNPVAAPGSGQSEYNNDYFPIMMASAFFDSGSGRDYVRSMLELLLNPSPSKKGKFTLPLLVGGSPLYDPQAPGWLRVAFKDSMPRDKNGIPQADVMQTGTIRLRKNSKRETPYMITNHMIAAGVTGRCTSTPDRIPDIRKYEAQDLVAASFLLEYAKNPDIEPARAKAAACRRWFGNDDGSGAPVPPDPKDNLNLCALAQMDLFFSPGPPPHPTYTMEQALQRCSEAAAAGDPCAACIAPPPANGAQPG
jgi:hypothetical protein